MVKSHLFKVSYPFPPEHGEFVQAQVQGKSQFFMSYISFTIAIHSSLDGDSFDSHLLVIAFLLATNIILIRYLSVALIVGEILPREIVQKS